MGKLILLGGVEVNSKIILGLNSVINWDKRTILLPELINLKNIERSRLKMMLESEFENKFFFSGYSEFEGKKIDSYNLEESDELLNLKKPGEVLFHLIEKIKENKKEYGSLWKVPPGFKRVTFDNFIKYNPKNVDVFMKIGNQKLIMVCSKEESNPTNVLKKYEKKGLESIYLTKEDYSSFFSNVLKLLNEKIQNVNNTKEEEVNLCLDSIENIHESLRNIGINDETLKLTDSIIETTLKSFQESDKLSPIVEYLNFSDGYIKNLAYINSYISVAVAFHSGWENMNILNSMVLSSFLMDAALLSDDLAQMIYFNEENNFKKLSTDDQLEVIVHPSSAVEFLGESMDQNSLTVKLILNHHERPGSHGFPSALNPNSLEPIVCSFILSHQVSHLLLQKKDPKRIRDIILDAYSDGGFERSIIGFKKTLETI